MTAHALIHVGLKKLGIAGDDARDLYERVTGARSLRAMTPPQHQAVVDELERLGFKRSSRPMPAKRATGSYAGKLQALWIAGWNLGIVRDNTDAAMLAFVKRQTSLGHSRFLRAPDEAARAIEALKAWLRRETGNDGLYRWEKQRPKLLNDCRFQILLTQWAWLAARDAAPAASLDAWVERMQAGRTYADFGRDDWIDLMNVLGLRLRKAMAKAEA
ncbi:regulatory protein GemA [Polymorphum gilvum]|uniref:Mu-like prophage protein gp16 n=1 Tax=Polymorphum gilvum (strain LMG 25793 / CGMCC 1.9160 / SL003B-26A1) TaxID=991905 RepID=F2J656_POLGS|nr:regulatory protein GemA [Polymorphum gilvum]ADZ72420.1 Mu-like prophage protein gp16 [Polymorphum gilvum SL003B-26A1]